MNNGWIKLHRKTISCGFFNNPHLHHFWTWCLLKTTHKPISVSVGYQVVDLDPGQFVFGRKVASAETGLSERTIRTCLQHLINLGNLTIKPTNKFSVISICKWSTYQNYSDTNDHQSDQQTTSKRPADDHIQEHKNKRMIRSKSVSEQFLKDKNSVALTDLPVHHIKAIEAERI